MAEDRYAHIARLRLRLQELRADFAFVEGEFKAGRISLTDEVAQLTQITSETNLLVSEITALVPSRSNPAPPDSN